MTQILSDYIRKNGIDGIKYNSFYTGNGINYTILNSDHRNITFDDSRIIQLQSERKTFLDFNQSKVVQADSKGGARFDIDRTQQLKKYILKNLK